MENDRPNAVGVLSFVLLVCQVYDRDLCSIYFTKASLFSTTDVLWLRWAALLLTTGFVLREVNVFNQNNIPLFIAESVLIVRKATAQTTFSD